MFFVQMTAHYLASHKINNLFLSHFYFIIQFILLSLFFNDIFIEKIQKLIIKLVFISVLITLIIQYLFNFNMFLKYNELEVIITSIPLILYCTLHLYNLLSESKKYYFFTIGFLIYLFGSTIIFLSGNVLLSMKSKMLSDIIIDLNIYLYIVYQFFILYQLYVINLNNKNYINNGRADNK